MAQLRSCITETSKILDLSAIVGQLDDYKESQRVSFPFRIDDIDAKVHFEFSKKGFAKVLLEIYHFNAEANTHRKFAFKIRCGTHTCCSPFIPVSIFRSGFPDTLTIAEIKKHKNIYVGLKLNYSKLCPQSSLSLQHQLDKMYHRSKQNGDVILMIKLNENEHLYIPKRKKQKRVHGNDGHKCCVCDAVFNSNRGLISHQTNKKDTAHKAYKNRNNCNELEHDNCDDLELRMSSVILQSASTVFDSMLSVDMKEKVEKKIEIMANSVKDVDDLLYFMCTHKVRDDYDAFALLELADYYEMDSLRCHCVNKLLERVSVDTFVQTVNMFDKYEISEHYESLIAFGKQNLEDLKNAENYDQLPHSVRCIVASSAK